MIITVPITLTDFTFSFAHCLSPKFQSDQSLIALISILWISLVFSLFLVRGTLFRIDWDLPGTFSCPYIAEKNFSTGPYGLVEKIFEREQNSYVQCSCDNVTGVRIRIVRNVNIVVGIIITIINIFIIIVTNFIIFPA